MAFKKYIRPVNLGIKTKLEQAVLELIAGFICAVFSYVGYEADLVILCYPTALVALICFMLSLYNLYELVQYWLSKSPDKA
ncbi:hypothetical protein RGQ13_15360 [Thalassotalea psychrophila]|uniref:Uncharacterized protein n=1 Tax=Thalassotalea psychrophila TaxID=3065647 RepID=A0ABY9TRQ4_9GAMM|nr:hypothetical protein RGQ13_15360 [Colwelliaceae bacterium SQ149]